MSGVKRLSPPGPVAQAFMASRAFIVGIIGPVGSGKTLAGLQKGMLNCAKQGGVRDQHGIIRRKGRVGIIRETYPNMDANILPSWFKLVSKDEGRFSGKAPYQHSFERVLRRSPAINGERKGQPIDICQVNAEFRAIGDRSVEDITRGWEIGCVIIDEFDLQPPELISFLTGRVGRFSDLAPELVVDPQIIVMLNAPYTDNHAYKLLIEKELGALADPELEAALNGRPLVECFVQPSGLSPQAENIHNLPGGRGYYILQKAANLHRPGYVERMLENKFVPMQHGQPVNPQFSFAEHVRPIEWNAKRPLVIGFDQGLYAAAVATQRTIMGELRSLREAVFFREDGKTLAKIGPSAFGERVRQMINDEFPDLDPKMLRILGDPAAWAAKDREDNEHDWVLAFQKSLGHRVHKAKSNSQAIRHEAIHLAMGQRDGYAVDPACKHLIRGHLGGYHFRKAEMADGETRGNLEVAETIHTHVCDAEQYAALEGEFVIGDILGKPRRDRRQPIRNDSDFDFLRGR